MVLVFALTVLGAIGLLSLAVWPGNIEVVLFGFPLLCLSLPLLGGWFVVLILVGLRDLLRKREAEGRLRRWGLRSIAVMIATMAMLWLHIPQSVMIACCGADLRELAETAPDCGERGAELGRRVGPYTIDRYGKDRRGGVYFRTGTGPDGIGPDLFSYGFAYRPNTEGSPFGNAHYRRVHLFGEWYAFAASDDW